MSEKKASTDTSSPDRPDGPDFEGALTELEALVARLEKGELTLDESLQQFKRGVELTRRCQRILDQAQQVVEQLTNPEDESTAVPLDPAD
jgi:exodeoxyribonuclease VII small subunit